jgi:hypothetical protein
VGSIRDLFAKVKAIDAKHGKFDLCLCVGDFFGSAGEDGEVSKDVTELLDGTLDGAPPAVLGNRARAESIPV